ncbi:hypothetical protein AYK24_00280 [Thermoplasmatales archaeon SG8-52-4]|nr:MAG: hypothetical protein AYK24_00280 [Thermoplasmatales archaeon SG8-52-4]
MEAGEMELRKTFEDVTKQNVQASIDFSNETRKLFRELEDKFKHLENTVLSQIQLIEGLKQQLSFVQRTLYAGGTEQPINPTVKSDG